MYGCLDGRGGEKHTPYAGLRVHMLQGAVMGPKLPIRPETKSALALPSSWNSMRVARLLQGLLQVLRRARKAFRAGMPGSARMTGHGKHPIDYVGAHVGTHVKGVDDRMQHGRKDTDLLDPKLIWRSGRYLAS